VNLVSNPIVLFCLCWLALGHHHSPESDIHELLQYRRVEATKAIILRRVERWQQKTPDRVATVLWMKSGCVKRIGRGFLSRAKRNCKDRIGFRHFMNQITMRSPGRKSLTYCFPVRLNRGELARIDVPARQFGCHCLCVSTQMYYNQFERILDGWPQVHLYMS
jgi:hypothetical protein